MERDLRKYRTNLTIGGTGVMIFGIWGVVKLLLYYFMTPAAVNKDSINNISYEAREISRIFMVSFAVAMIVLVIVELVLRAIIWRLSVKEGQGKKCGYVHIVLAIIIGVTLTVSDIMYMVSPVARTHTIFDNIIIVIVDSTSLLALFDVIFSSFKVKKLSKELGITG